MNLEGWVVKRGKSGYAGCVAIKRDGWLCWLRACLSWQALWVRIQASLKTHKMGDISKEVANAL
jgi:hypothetical protein